MPAISHQRAHWLARYILPLEPQLRAWLVRAVPGGLQPDDVIQEAYAKLAVLPSVLDIQQPKAYLFQVARRVISEHIRRAHVIPIETMAELACMPAEQEGRSPERIVSAHQELERLCSAVDNLSGACRTVFILRKIEEMTHKEIAAHLKISERCVEKRLARALKGIMKSLQAAATSPAREVPATTGAQNVVRLRKRGSRAP